MTQQPAATLINPQTNELALRVVHFDNDRFFERQQTHNHYSIMLVTGGAGKVECDVAEYSFEGNVLICFSIYEPFAVVADKQLEGVLINFHPDFFCIHKHHHEVACDGVLFNDLYKPPLIPLRETDTAELLSVAEKMEKEMRNPASAQYELLVSWLKILLITASRLKMDQRSIVDVQEEKRPFILKELKDAIETHFRSKHSPGEYATLLSISPRALNRIVKTHLNRTVRRLIGERLVIEAKRELYLTSKPIKSIAFELGFPDEFYFSRFFKNIAEVSPHTYRSTVGFARGEDR